MEVLRFLFVGVGGSVLFDIGDNGRLSQGIEDDADDDDAGLLPSPWSRNPR